MSPCFSLQCSLFILLCLLACYTNALKERAQIVRHDFGVRHHYADEGASTTRASWKGQLFSVSRGKAAPKRVTSKSDASQAWGKLNQVEGKISESVSYIKTLMSTVNDLEKDTLRAQHATQETEQNAKGVDAAMTFLDKRKSTSPNMLSQLMLVKGKLETALQNADVAIKKIKKATQDVEEVMQKSITDRQEVERVLQTADTVVETANKETEDVNSVISETESVFETINAFIEEADSNSVHVMLLVVVDKIKKELEVAKTHQAKGEVMKQKTLSLMREMEKAWKAAPMEVISGVQERIDSTIAAKTSILEKMDNINKTVSDIAEISAAAVNTVSNMDEHEDIDVATIHLQSINKTSEDASHKSKSVEMHVLEMRGEVDELKKSIKQSRSTIAYSKANNSLSKVDKFAQWLSTLSNIAEGAVSEMRTKHTDAPSTVKDALVTKLQLAQQSAEEVSAALNEVRFSYKKVDQIMKEATVAHNVVMQSAENVEETESVSRVESAAVTAGEEAKKADESLTNANTALRKTNQTKYEFIATLAAKKCDLALKNAKMALQNITTKRMEVHAMVDKIRHMPVQNSPRIKNEVIHHLSIAEAALSKAMHCEADAKLAWQRMEENSISANEYAQKMSEISAAHETQHIAMESSAKQAESAALQAELALQRITHALQHVVEVESQAKIAFITAERHVTQNDDLKERPWRDQDGLPNHEMEKAAPLLDDAVDHQESVIKPQKENAQSPDETTDEGDALDELIVDAIPYIMLLEYDP